MPKRFVPTTRWTGLAAALCAVAAAFVGYQVWRSAAPVAPPSARAPAADPAAATADGGAVSSGFELSPSADYVEIVERPLFNPTRKPAPPDEAKPGSGAGAEETAATQIALNGIVLVGNRRVALLRFDNDPKVMHVAEGQQAGGWRIEKITADRVTLRRGQQENQVVLDYKRRGGNEQAGAPVPSPTNGEMTGTVPRDDEAVE